MKYEWRKSEKEFYLPKQIPEIKIIPKTNYIAVAGKGNPNEPLFSAKIQSLFSLAYAIRMMPRNGYEPPGYFVYTVYPLEGVWDFPEDTKPDDEFSKDNFIYNIMIKQPSFVDEDIFIKAKEIVKSKKKDNEFTDDVIFTPFLEEKVVQMLHLGSFDNESVTFGIMSDFIKKEGLKRTLTSHREIYLSDFKKVAPEKLKTVLRYNVK